jgi:hypothetical protein
MNHLTATGLLKKSICEKELATEGADFDGDSAAKEEM